MASLFVYGTLIHPHILARVLAGTLRRPSLEDPSTRRFSHLRVVPALLPKYQLYRVRDQEYPALAPIDTAAGAEGSHDTNAVVRGVVVSGLSEAELAALDLFEGDEYTRETVEVLVASADEPVSNDVRSSWSADTIGEILESTLPAERVQALLSGSEESDKQQVQGYIWVADASELEDKDGPRGPWEFLTFAKGKSSRWTSGEWTDAGGPDGVEVQEGTPPQTPIVPQGSSAGGFDEIRRTMTGGQEGSASSLNTGSAFSGLTLGAGDDPWADPAPAATLISPSATEKSTNPWASNALMGTNGQAGDVQDPTVSSSLSVPGEEIPEGYPLELEGWQVPGYETFGKPISRWWFHGVKQGEATAQRRYLSFNNGSLGSCPKPVFEAYQNFALKAEENADLFDRRTAPPALKAVRTRVAEFLKCPASTIAIIMNSTTGTNSVVRGFPWEDGDHVVVLSSLYGALAKTFEYVQDAYSPKPTLVRVETTYPLSHKELVDKFKDQIQSLRSAGKKVRMAAFDAITSMPGLVLPWEELVAVCREEGIYSLVDGAHAFGQIELDLGKTQPDFFVTNAHKWGYVHRSCAIFYVPLKNQHLVPSGLPTSWFYRSKAERDSVKEKEEGNDFTAQWDYPGTIDQSSFLSIDAALDFRQKIGGEARIRSYIHSLALLGGLTVARILGTELLETSPPSLTAAMSNVRLPLASRVVGTDPNGWLASKGDAWLSSRLFDEFNTYLRFTAHNNQVYGRISAQVWLELEDYEYLGRALKELCRRINAGEGP